MGGRLILLLHLCLAVITLAPVGAQGADCSDYLGRATLNEVFSGDTAHIELKILDDGIGQAVYDDWALSVCNAAEGCTTVSVSAGTVSDGFVVVPVPENFISLSTTGRGAGTDILLIDDAGEPIDYLAVAGHAPQEPDCDFDFDTDFPGSNSFTAARVPDGTGEWTGLGPGNSIPPSEGSSNDDGTGPDGNPVARVDVENVTVRKGETADFVISLFDQNGDPSTFPYDVTIQFVTLDDTAFSDQTVEPPDHDYLHTSGTATIAAGSLSATVSVPTNAEAPAPEGAQFWLRIQNPAGTDDPVVILNYFASATFATGPPAADHFSISHDGSGVNCQAEAMTISAHDAYHNQMVNYAGTVEISTSTGHGDWSVVSAVADNLTNAGSGSATYVFDGSEGGSVVLGMKNPFAETVNMHVDDGFVAEAPGEDPDLVFSASGFNVLTDGAVGAIGTQIAGKPSDVDPGAQILELQAIRTDEDTGSCEAALSGSVDVEMGFECLDPDTCGGAGLFVNGSAVAGTDAGAAPANWSVVSLDFGDALDATAPMALQYADAGRIQLHARYEIPLDDESQPLSGVYMNGSSNAFVVRPFALQVDVSGNPSAETADGPVFAAAGADFSVGVRAVAWQGADDTNADGVADGHDDPDPANNAELADNSTVPAFGRELDAETVDLSATLIRPGGGNDPGLSAATAIDSFSAGAGSASIRFEEVGIIEIAASLADGDYLGSGADAGGRSGYVGRFVPDHFDVTVTPGCNVFNYSGQPFDHPHTAASEGVAIAARNAGGVAPANYHGGTGFAKDVTLSDEGDTSGFSGNLVPAADFNHGFALDGDIAYTFADRHSAPKSLTLRAIDADGVNSSGALEEAVEIRSGRLRLMNAFGSELHPLSVPLQAEYYAGEESGYLINADDGCTTVEPVDLLLTTAEGSATGDAPIAVAPGATTEASIANDPLTSGIAGLTLSAPGEGGAGYVDIRVDLSAAGWLRYDWDGDGAHDNDPSARATFGIYEGSPSIIFQREVPR